MEDVGPDRRTFCRIGGCALAGAVVIAGFPADVPAGEGGAMPGQVTSVTAKVLSIKGTCEQGHKVGDVTTFTESGVQGRICIHALYSMIPAVFAMMFESKFPWLKDPDTKTHACPDAANPVVFEITRHRA